MALDNYQTGWWINNGGTGLWSETDKPVNNKCDTTDDCGADLCCSYWPDSNNKRCVDASLDGEEQTLLPFANWTPACIAGGDDGPPIPAVDDLSNEALSQAAQALTDFVELMKTSLKEADGFEDLTEDE